jgi:U3 small nucleolar RNA-associated protein 4
MSVVVCPCALPFSESSVVNPLKLGPASTFEDAHHQRLPYAAGISPVVCTARHAKLVLCRRNTSLTIWRIKKSLSLEEFEPTQLEASARNLGDAWEKLVDMELKTRTNLVSAAIADDGSWVAAADLYEIKLFQLIHVKVRFLIS